MRLPINTMLTLAWRNLWRNHRRTLIMLAAIIIGVWAMIFMTAMMRGMVDQMIKEGIQNLPGHVQIHHPEFLDDPSVVNSIDEPDEKLLEAFSNTMVRAWTSRIKVPAVVSSEYDNRGVVLIGIEPDSESRFGFSPDRISEGRYLDSGDDKGIIIGARLAQRLETRLGKRIVVMTQDPDNNIADRGFRIVGIYSATLSAQEEAFIYVAKNTLAKLLKIPGRTSEIAVMGHDYREIAPLYELINSFAGKEVQVRGWDELDSYLGTMLSVMDGFVLIWIVVIFLALSFGLVNTLVMAVFERVREIGLMLSLGMRPGTILYQILLESFLLLLIGLAAGNILAVATIKPLESGIDISGVAQGMEMMGAGSVLYPALDAGDLILANIIVVVLGLLTSLLPAWRASTYDPVEAINKT